MRSLKKIEEEAKRKKENLKAGGSKAKRTAKTLEKWQARILEEAVTHGLEKILKEVEKQKEKIETICNITDGVNEAVNSEKNQSIQKMFYFLDRIKDAKNFFFGN